jgi:hypothetical protein
MARLSQGILGGVLGKIGNVVGSSWKGIAVIKSMPLSVANPRTAGQVAQRSKMKNVVAFAIIILSSIIKPLNDRFAQRASGFNDFVRRNIDLFAGVLPSTFADLKLSVGKMVAVTPTTVTGSEDSGEATIVFPTTLPDAFAQATDEVYAVVINETQNYVGYSSAEATRADGTVDVVLPGDFVAADVVHGYLCFRRTDGTVVSNTGYKIGTVV